MAKKTPKLVNKTIKGPEGRYITFDKAGKVTDASGMKLGKNEQGDPDIILTSLPKGKK